ncbi:MAG: hypothetical protein K6G09_01550 [Treponema sp.]|nr:hypothetical protein [Treponema sp.]
MPIKRNQKSKTAAKKTVAKPKKEIGFSWKGATGKRQALYKADFESAADYNKEKRSFKANKIRIRKEY